MLYNLRFILASFILMGLSTTVPAYIAKAIFTPKPPPEVKHVVPRVSPGKPKEVTIPIKSWRKK